MVALGPYTLHHRLGQGGMGEVWAATRLLPGGVTQDVVVKRIRAERRDELGFDARFLDEARIAARVSHPNVVRVVDFGLEDGAWYLAMERVRGADLSRVIRGAGGRLPASIALYVAHEVARGLTAAHAATDASGRPLGLVHRDVCAPNILLGRDGHVRLTDFGVASLSGDAGLDVGGHRSTMSPEQAEGRPVDARSDIFSLGVVLYQLLTGEAPFGDTEPEALRRRVAAGSLPPPSSLGSSPALDPVVMRSLMLDPDERYPTAEAFRVALRGALSPSAPDLQAVALRAMLPGWLAAPPAADEQPTVVDLRSPAAVREQALAKTAVAAAPGAPETVRDPLRVPSVAPQSPAPPAAHLAPVADDTVAEDTVLDRAPVAPAPRRRRLLGLLLVALLLLSMGGWWLWPRGAGDPPGAGSAEALATAVAPDPPTGGGAVGPGDSVGPDPVGSADDDRARTETARVEPATEAAPAPQPHVTKNAAPPRQPAPPRAASSAAPSAPPRPAAPPRANPPASPRQAAPPRATVAAAPVEPIAPAPAEAVAPEAPARETRRRRRPADAQPVEAAPSPRPEAPALAETPDATDPGTPGTLTLRLSSNWGWVRIDGERIKGSTPITDLELTPGLHRVRVETPSTGRVYHHDVTIRPGQPAVLVVEVD